MATDPKIVAAICAIPRGFRGGNISPRDLVAATGFRSVRESIRPSEIRARLEADPSLIDDWQVWSEDKRSSEGWYLITSNDGGRVGYFGTPGSESRYDSHVEACAHFIIRELEAIDSGDSRRARTT